LELDTSLIVNAVREPLEKFGVKLLIFAMMILGTYLISFLILKAIRLPYKFAHFIASLLTFFAMYKSYMYIFFESHI